MLTLLKQRDARNKYWLGTRLVVLSILLVLSSCSSFQGDRNTSEIDPVVENFYSALQIVDVLEQSGIECSQPVRKSWSAGYDSLRCRSGSGSLEFYVFKNASKKESYFIENCGGWRRLFIVNDRYISGENWIVQSVHQTLVTPDEVALALQADSKPFVKSCPGEEDSSEIEPTPSEEPEIGVELSLLAEQETYFKVIRSDGSLVFEGKVIMGAQWTFTDELWLEVVLEDPSVVFITVNGVSIGHLSEVPEPLTKRFSKGDE